MANEPLTFHPVPSVASVSSVAQKAVVGFQLTGIRWEPLRPFASSAVEKGPGFQLSLECQEGVHGTPYEIRGNRRDPSTSLGTASADDEQGSGSGCQGSDWFLRSCPLTFSHLFSVVLCQR